MTNSDITDYRLINQQITASKFQKPQEIVSWLGAMQAQEFAMAKWAIGLRLPGLNDADVEKAFNDGAILRTHLLRPTWHFVSPADIRWMLALTAPRVNAVNAYWYRKFELDDTLFKRSNDTLIKKLQGGKQLTRATLKSALERENIMADGLRLSYLMMRAELEGLICSGARQGKQFTYALLDERVPAAALAATPAAGAVDREEALAELAKRYFASRGPATLRDFVYWSGLTMKEAKSGVAAWKQHFVREVSDGQEYLFAPTKAENKPNLQTTFLLPDYDEYRMSYKNHSAQFNPENITPENRGGNASYNHMIVIDGMIGGAWQRTIKNNTIVVETNPFISLNKTQHQAVINAVQRYCSFICFTTLE